jgi:hypothetical protein
MGFFILLTVLTALEQYWPSRYNLTITTFANGSMFSNSSLNFFGILNLQ